MEISVVIPTRNRKASLMSLLENLRQSLYPVSQVVIVDSSDHPMEPQEYLSSGLDNIIYLRSEPSVCVQRNMGIRAATSPWVFICDDDIEVPTDYLQKLVAHIRDHPEAGAVSGVVLQQEGEEWKGSYPVTSAKELLLKYLFRLGFWGEIACKGNNVIIRKLKAYYARKGNHISRSGWPVITNFSGKYFTVPVYGLGASLVRREWLLSSPYDEVLDKHGIGDNYGVAIGFPGVGIQVLNAAVVYHHQESSGRLQKPLQYFRRALALDYFIRRGKNQRHVKRGWLLYSLFGNLIIQFLAGDKSMMAAGWKTFRRMLFGYNPYYGASKRNEIGVNPLLDITLLVFLMIPM